MEASRMDKIGFSGIREIYEHCQELESQGKDVIHLETGQPDFDTPEQIKEAGSKAIEDGKVHYTSNYGISNLREKISSKFAADNGLDYNASNEIIVTTGATEAVFISVLALVDADEEVLIPNPCWTYEPGIRAAGGDPVYYDLDPEKQFRPDLDSLSDAVSQKTKLIIVNSPHNPTGNVLTKEDAKAIRDLAVENDLIVLSDEIYEKLIYDGNHQSLAQIDGMFDRTITVNGFSKAYSMTGWRLGYLGAPEELIDPIIRIRQYTTTCAPSISQHAGARALDGNLYQPMVETYAARKERVMERLESIPGMTAPEPRGAFYVFPSIPNVADDESDFVWSLLNDEHVALVPGTVFGSSGKNRVRIAYANSTRRIDEAFDRIESWIATQN